MKNILATLSLALISCASSSHIMLGTARAPIPPEQVKVYTSAPAGSTDIAILTVDAVGWTSQGEMNRAINGLKSEAAKLGANGVLLATVNSVATGAVGNINPATGTLWVGQSTSTVAKATAIYIP